MFAFLFFFSFFLWSSQSFSFCSGHRDLYLTERATSFALSVQEALTFSAPVQASANSCVGETRQTDRQTDVGSSYSCVRETRKHYRDLYCSQQFMCETDRQTDIDVVGSNSSYVRETDRDRDLLCSQQFLRERERRQRICICAHGPVRVSRGKRTSICLEHGSADDTR